MIQIYPAKLVALLNNTSDTYIPKRLQHDEKLKIYRKYWCTQDPNSFFKVESIFTENNIEYYEIKFLHTQQYAVITQPIDNKTCYELMNDKNKIRKLPYIINCETPYFGSEIRYWFFKHNINLEEDKYSVFKHYILYNDSNSIADYKVYFLNGESLDDGSYKSCRVIGL